MCTREDFLVGHPSWNCFGPSTLNPGVLYSWAYEIEGISWWYEYSINHIKLWARMSQSKPGMSPLAHVHTSGTGISILYVQLAAYIPYRVTPRGPTHYVYVVEVVLWYFHRHCLEQPTMVLSWWGLRFLEFQLWGKHGRHDGLHGSGHQSIIPYIHRESAVVLMCVVWSELKSPLESVACLVLL
jgi:hypothetical protein